MVQDLDVRGKAHNRENAQNTAGVCRLCQSIDLLSFSPTGSLQIPIPSKKTGSRVSRDSIVRHVVETVLHSTLHVTGREDAKLSPHLGSRLVHSNRKQDGLILAGTCQRKVRRKLFPVPLMEVGKRDRSDRVLCPQDMNTRHTLHDSSSRSSRESPNHTYEYITRCDAPIPFHPTQ
ncbi:hypothetical protein VUR80DRAFT_981 [Thermomyces stellatus]